MTERPTTATSNPVRYLHHQNTERVKAESEMISRFEKHKVAPKPPLVSKQNMWSDMIDRTWVQGQDVKRGDFALSERRKVEMV